MLVVSLLAGWTVALQQDPYHPEVSPPPTAISIHIESILWVPSGCGLVNHTSSGSYFRAGSVINQSLDVTNHNTTSGCVISGLILGPLPFLSVGSNLPLTVSSDTSSIVKVTIQLPSFAPPTNVTISLSASFQA